MLAKVFSFKGLNFSVNAFKDWAPEKQRGFFAEAERLEKYYKKLIAEARPETKNTPAFKKMTELYEKMQKKVARLKKEAAEGVLVTPGFVKINPGEFIMGSDKDGDNPKHKVKITRPFELGQYQVTQKEFLKFRAKHQFAFPGNPRNPAEKVTWHDAVGYCIWFSLKAEDIDQTYKDAIKEISAEAYVVYAWAHPEAKLYRLPTDSEWEYACREEGQLTTDYLGADNLSDIDTYAVQNKGKQNNESTQSVGTKNPNKKRLYDMIGNVWEWCLDWYDQAAFKDTAKKYVDPCNLKESGYRLLRGGSWSLGGDGYFRCSYRRDGDPTIGFNDYGFRLARSLPQDG